MAQMSQSDLVKRYTAAADRAVSLASMKGLRGAARRRAEIARSTAIHAERMRAGVVSRPGVTRKGAKGARSGGGGG